MPRRPLVIALLALLVAVVVVPILVLTLAGTGAAPGERDAAESVEPIAPLIPGDVGWVYAAQLFDAPGPSYTLQAGTLGAGEAAVDIEVPFAVDPDVQVGRSPAVGAVVGGSVVYVSDDGVRSTVRRVGVLPNAADEQMAILDEVVWAIAVAPDSQHAYLALVDRADHQRGLGIARLSLDGRGQLEPLLDPAAGARAELAIRPSAVLAFDVDLAMSLDGRHLVRRTCAGARGCAESVVDVQSGEVTELGQRHVLGAAGGMVLSQECSAECTLELIDLASGELERLPGLELEATMALVGGRPRVAFVELTADGAVLRALDPRDGSVVGVLRGRDREQSITVSPPGADLRVSIPDGYVLASVSGDDAGAIITEHSMAVPLDGGPPVELPRPPFHPEIGGVQG